MGDILGGHLTEYSTLVAVFKELDAIIDQNAALKIELEDLKREKSIVSHNNQPKLTKREVAEIRDMRRLGLTTQEIADIYDVNRSTISRTVRGHYHK